MTEKESAELDRELGSHGWTYDPAKGEFRSGERRVEWEELVALMPGLCFDDLMAFEGHKHDEWRKSIKRPRASNELT